MDTSNRTYTFAVMVALLMALSPATTRASDDYRYDWATRNSFSWYAYSPDVAKERGHAWNTGSHWASKVRTDGSLSGWNEKGNYWRYDSGSKLYYNYSTGEIRYRGLPMW